MTKIVICVCTYKRPQMLRGCLTSLAAQQLPFSASLEAVVVDNQPDGGNRDIVAELAKDHPYPLHYVHEPERGISSARNACLDKAAALGADWLAFIDDDEIAAPDWIIQLWSAHLRHSEAHAIWGPMKRQYPPGTPAWRCRTYWDSEYRDRYDGQPMEIFSTNNVMFDLPFVVQHGLRFNVTQNFVGGEDYVFSTKMHQAGGSIVWCPAAVTYEMVSRDRTTVWHHIRQAQQKGFHAVKLSRLLKRPELVLVMRAGRRILSSLGQLIIVLPLSIFLGPTAFLRCAMSGGRKFAEAVGIVRGLAGQSSTYYRKTTGY